MNLKSLLYSRRGGKNYQFKTFSQRYHESILLHAERPAIVFYDLNLTRLEKTFAEFDLDVSAVRTTLKKNYSQIQTFVTLGGNTYLHMAWIVAILLEGFELCLLNPTESGVRLKKKISALTSTYALVLGPDVGSTDFPEAAVMSIPKETSFLKESPPPEKNDHSAFTLIFTSGSTGYSKLVEQTEAGVLANIEDLIQHHQLGPGQVVATSMPIHHVNALEFSFFCCLLSGAKIVLHEQFNFYGFLQSINKDSVTIMSHYPSLLRIFLERPPQFNAALHQNFRYVVTAASSLSAGLAAEWIAKMKCRLVQGYGLSEAVNFSCIMPTDLDQAVYEQLMTQYKTACIGTALPCNDIFILDESGKPCSEGTQGEICIRGINVMAGYRNEPQADCFKGNYLRTGDLGYYITMADNRNYYFISGRIKDVLKTLGETVSLVEVDDILAGNQLQVEAVAVGLESNLEGEVVAVFANPPRDQITLDRFQEYLAQNLEGPMRPRLLVIVDRPLRTVSGKPKRGELRSMLEARLPDYKSTKRNAAISIIQL